MDLIEQIIRRAIHEKQSGKIVVDDDSLFSELSNNGPSENWWTLRYKRGFRFVFLCAMMIFVLVFLVSSIIFYINDVILFQNELRVNKYGSFIPRKACNSEYALFMFNTSELWANTGIQINRGDRIKIAVSGAFHPSVVDVMDAARENRELEQVWIDSKVRMDMDREPKSRPDSAYWIYNGKDAYFGSVLYQIRPEYSVNREWDADSEVHQISLKMGQNFCRINESGILHLSINDIYLTDEVVDSKIAELVNNGGKVLNEEADLFYVDEKTGCKICDEYSVHKYFSEHRDVWFDDNLGQIMVVVEIQRRWSMFNSHNWYRILERNIVRVFEESDRWYETLFYAGGKSCAFVLLFAVGISAVACGCMFFILAVLYMVFLLLQFASDICNAMVRKSKVSRLGVRIRHLLDRLF